MFVLMSSNTNEFLRKFAGVNLSTEFTILVELYT